MSSKSRFGDLIRTARTGNPENQTAIIGEKDVNLSVKVPVSLRRHWAAQAKLSGITMTSVIIRALIEQFGEPD